MKRLRIGVKLPFFPNAGVYARDVSAKDVPGVQAALTMLSNLLDIRDGKEFGVATWVVRLDPK